MTDTKRVVLMDSEDDVLSAFEFRLGEAGSDLAVAHNGAEALELLNQQRADPVVLYSANTDSQFRRKALDLGASDYLPKTAGAKAIIECICKLAPLGKNLSAGPATLARSLADMLKIAAGDVTLSGSAKFAVASSQRIADDLLKLLSDSSGSATRH